MSYQPPRPPMGMPPMGYQGYGYPMGMMAPMGMGMMQMMRPTGAGVSNDKKQNNKKLVPQEIPKSSDKKDDKAPVTTVFVGNISDRAPDAMVRQMLQRCGNVLSWKRVQGASGKLQAFGFCEYEEPEATLRCIRLLNEWKITDKKLVVKVDAKTKQQLDEWRDKKKEKEGKKENGEKEEGQETDDEDDLDEFTMREDRVAKAGLDAIMREYSHELAKEPPQEVVEEKKEKKKREKHTDGPKDTGIEDMGLEDDKRDIINREIRSFRDAHKICWGKDCAKLPHRIAT